MKKRFIVISSVLEFGDVVLKLERTLKHLAQKTAQFTSTTYTKNRYVCNTLNPRSSMTCIIASQDIPKKTAEIHFQSCYTWE